MSDLTKLYDANPTAPGYYPGSTVAPQSAQTQQTIDALTQRGMNGTATGNAAQGAVTDTLNGKYLDPTTNPSYLAALNASHQPYIDQFMNQVIPGTTSAFEGSGRTGSGAHQAAVDQATTGLNRTISDADAKAGSAYYSGERDRMLGAAGMAPALNSMGLQDIAALGQAGDTQDAYSQSKINEDISRYNYGNNSQWDYISRYLGSLNSGYPGGVTNGLSTGTQTMPGSSPWGSILGGAGLGLQGLSAIAPFLGFSDERLKEDISVPIGATFDGIPIRHWRYKGDPTPHLGVIAQEVEKVRPEAVVEHPSGYKMVNHRGLF